MMSFEIEGKVALVTGGASGLGKCYVKELFRNGLKGISIADVDQKLGESVMEEIQKEFGSGKAMFVKTDVSNHQQFEDAFNKTIEMFQCIDILINNAGVVDEKNWDKEIEVNMKGPIHGILLGLEHYLQKYRQGTQAVILNTASIAGIAGSAYFPLYSATKFAVIGLTHSFGHKLHHERTGVKIVALCPGITLTNMMPAALDKTLGGPYEELGKNYLPFAPVQKPEHVAKELIKIIQCGPPGSVWIVDGGAPAEQYILPERKRLQINDKEISS